MRRDEQTPAGPLHSGAGRRRPGRARVRSHYPARQPGPAVAGGGRPASSPSRTFHPRVSREASSEGSRRRAADRSAAARSASVVACANLYQAGDCIITLAPSAGGLLVTSQRGQVIGVDHEGGNLTVRMHGGRTHTLGPDQIAGSAGRTESTSEAPTVMAAAPSSPASAADLRRRRETPGPHCFPSAPTSISCSDGAKQLRDARRSGDAAEQHRRSDRSFLSKSCSRSTGVGSRSEELPDGGDQPPPDRTAIRLVVFARHEQAFLDKGPADVATGNEQHHQGVPH